MDSVAAVARQQWVIFRGKFEHMISPVVPSTSTSAPGGRRRVAPCTSTTQGKPNSRATTAACDIGPPSSVTTAAA